MASGSFCRVVELVGDPRNVWSLIRFYISLVFGDKCYFYFLLLLFFFL